MPYLIQGDNIYSIYDWVCVQGASQIREDLFTMDLVYEFDEKVVKVFMELNYVNMNIFLNGFSVFQCLSGRTRVVPQRLRWGCV